MKNLRLVAIFAIAVLITALSTPAEAQRPYRMSERAMKNLLERIENGADRFRKSLDNALDKGRFDDTKAEDNINRLAKEFEEATDRLKDRYDDDESAEATVEEVLARAARLDNFMRRHRLTREAQSDWQYLRGQLNRLARAYRVSWGWVGPTARPYRISESEVKSLLSRIETGADRFRASLDDALDRSAINNTRVEDRINESVKQFEEATDRLKDRYSDQDSAALDAHEVLRRAARINGFMRHYRLTQRAQNDWRSLRTNLDQLARTYHVSWTW